MEIGNLFWLAGWRALPHYVIISIITGGSMAAKAVSVFLSRRISSNLSLLSSICNHHFRAIYRRQLHVTVGLRKWTFCHTSKYKWLINKYTRWFCVWIFGYLWQFTWDKLSCQSLSDCLQWQFDHARIICTFSVKGKGRGKRIQGKAWRLIQ